MKNAEGSPNGQKKKMWEKEKLLITSNFSFSYSVTERLVLQTRIKQGLFGKVLMAVLRSVYVTSETRVTIENSSWSNLYLIHNP